MCSTTHSVTCTRPDRSGNSYRRSLQPQVAQKNSGQLPTKEPHPNLGGGAYQAKQETDDGGAVDTHEGDGHWDA